MAWTFYLIPKTLSPEKEQYVIGQLAELIQKEEIDPKETPYALLPSRITKDWDIVFDEGNVFLTVYWPENETGGSEDKEIRVLLTSNKHNYSPSITGKNKQLFFPKEVLEEDPRLAFERWKQAIERDDFKFIKLTYGGNEEIKNQDVDLLISILRASGDSQGADYVEQLKQKWGDHFAANYLKDEGHDLVDWSKVTSLSKGRVNFVSWTKEDKQNLSEGVFLDESSLPVFSSPREKERWTVNRDQGVSIRMPEEVYVPRRVWLDPFALGICVVSSVLFFSLGGILFWLVK